jgi:serpin B
MKSLAALVCILVAGSVFAQAPDAPVPAKGQTPVTRDNAAFAMDLYGKLRDGQGNLACSPHSISVALAMTYAGARGETAAEMRKALRFELADKDLFAGFAEANRRLNEMQRGGKVRLSLVNSLWPQQKYQFLPDYLTLLEQSFGAVATPLDYAGGPEKARATINEWVEAKTEKRITELIPPRVIDELTRLVLVNAIHFKADWDKKFDKAATRDASFHVAPGQEVTVPMMNLETDGGYGEFDRVQVLWLPYAGREIGMTIILPKDKDGLADVEASLTVEKLREWTQPIPKLRKVRVSLPRFKATSDFRLDSALQSLGIRDAFSMTADFSGMDGQKWLCIGAVLHKAFVEVNEEGSEAAAATAVEMRLKSAPARLPVFNADHPFLFLIRDNPSGSILFIGRMANPG